MNFTSLFVPLWASVTSSLFQTLFFYDFCDSKLSLSLSFLISPSLLVSLVNSPCVPTLNVRTTQGTILSICSTSCLIKSPTLNITCVMMIHKWFFSLCLTILLLSRFVYLFSLASYLGYLKNISSLTYPTQSSLLSSPYQNINAHNHP